MTEEQKQALIAACAERVKAMKIYCACEPQDKEAALDLTLVEISMAALTAHPIKLPDRYDIGSMIDVEKDDDGPLYLCEDVIDAIRAAGREVQE